ncbi:MAG: 3-keto-5-aminohexanoate cleavage protein, partial [Deltaproteobacteria bacterium]|nr:3-keto-5-aminohexanoate cleavage protein [Deltaproteobacteria bacterium]
MTKKTWIEVALNGAWTRKLQPRIPVLASEIIDEGAACIKAGAAIIHAHTLDPDTGRQNGDVDNCAAFMAGIRQRVDAIVYPTVVGKPDPSNPAWLWDPAIELAKRGLLEWGFLDPGSVNFCRFDNADADMGGPGVYVNTNPALDAAAKIATEYKFHPAYACYEAGFVRHGALLHRRNPSMPVPIYRVMLSSGMTFSFPPEPWAVEAYAKLLAACAPGSPWMIAGLAVDVLPLIATVVALGGGVRVGLEDS